MQRHGRGSERQVSVCVNKNQKPKKKRKEEESGSEPFSSFLFAGEN
jgi:hypothetical protein